MRASQLPFGQRDVLVFKQGKFISSRSEKAGFEPSAYEAGQDGRTAWVAMLENKQGEKMLWEGRMTKDQGMTGFYAFRNEDGSLYMTNWTARRGG